MMDKTVPGQAFLRVLLQVAMATDGTEDNKCLLNHFSISPYMFIIHIPPLSS
jgi:hypothetical protein